MGEAVAQAFDILACPARRAHCRNTENRQQRGLRHEDSHFVAQLKAFQQLALFFSALPFGTHPPGLLQSLRRQKSAPRLIRHRCRSISVNSSSATVMIPKSHIRTAGFCMSSLEITPTTVPSIDTKHQSCRVSTSITSVNELPAV